MGEVLEKYDRGKNQKRTQKGCMPFYHSLRNFVLEVVSIRWSKITGEEETGRTTSRGKKKKRQFEGKVHYE